MQVKDPKHSAVVAELERLLTQEIHLQTEYLKAMQAERAALVQFKTHAVQELTLNRNDILDKISAIQQRRRELIEDPALVARRAPPLKLSAWIASNCSVIERKRLEPLVAALRAALVKTTNQAREYTGVVDFSLGLVKGTVSLLRSASESVSNVYNPGGRLKTQYIPNPLHPSPLARRA